MPTIRRQLSVKCHYVLARTTRASVVSSLLLLLASFVAVDAAELSEQFQEPPASAEPYTWWHWMNGNISKEGITADLEDMAEVGLGGAQIFNIAVETPDGPIRFNSPEWLEMVKHAATEADRLSLDLGIHNSAGWANSGGPWITPEYGMQVITSSELEVQGPRRFDEVLPQPPSRLGFYRDISVLAFRTPPQGVVRPENLAAKVFQERGKESMWRDVLAGGFADRAPSEDSIPLSDIVELTDQTEAARLIWEVPAGDWTILRLGYTPTGKGNRPAPEGGKGLEVDKLSQRAVEAHWAASIDPLIQELGPLVGQSFNNVLVDSYEVGSQNWTSTFREDFKQRRGYDLQQYLPALMGHIVENSEVTERFLWDFRRTIADLFAANYAGTLADLAHENDLLYYVEPYGSTPAGGPPSSNLQYGSQADVPMGEFWANGSAVFTTKMAASIAHINGRKIVAAEAFTAGPQDSKWKLDPFALKALGDRVFCAGVNRLFFHSYAHQPWIDRYPGMTMALYGTHIGRTTTWWKQGGEAWHEYLTRCQYMLQQGLFVADVVYYVGESVPSAMPLQSLPSGYDFDGCDTAALHRMSVKNGRLTLPDGMSYSMLVLPEDTRMTLSTARQINELANSGASIVGPRPVSTPGLSGYPQRDDEVRQLAAETKIFTGETAAQHLEALGILPDFEVASPSLGLTYIHRVTDEADIYFVANPELRNVVTEGIFRISGKTPEFWYPDSGRIEPAPEWREEDGRTIVPLRLDPAGSVFVVFREPAVAEHIVSVEYLVQSSSELAIPTSEELEILSANYGVFDHGKPVPGKSVNLTEQVAALVMDGQLIMTVGNQFAGGDPAPRIKKEFLLHYRYAGIEKTLTLQEDAKMQLPTGRSRSALPSFEVVTDAYNQSVFQATRPGSVVAKTSTGKVLKATVSAVPLPIEITGPWELNFPPKWSAPARVELSELISWTQHSDLGVKYFSGTATYVKELNIPQAVLGEDRLVWLDLGHVKNIAEVSVNGRQLGVLWKPPYSVDMTAVARSGLNRIEIKVTNLWPNRLIGDEQLPADTEWKPNGGIKEFPQWLLDNESSPTGRVTFTTWRHWKKNDAPLESGLLGPVSVIFKIKEPLK